MVQIVFLGVGGWISESFLGYTSLLLKLDDKAILIDAGEGVYRALRCCGYDVNDINSIIITHRHGDHMLGLPTLVLMSLHRGIDKVKVITIRDVIEAIERLFEIVGLGHLLKFVEFIEVKPDMSIGYNSFSIRFIESLHTIPTVSLRIDVGDKCIAFSSDTRHNPKLIDVIRNCDVLIHEVSNYNPDAHLYGHSSYQDAIDIANKANVKIFVPIHFYQQPMPLDLSLFTNTVKPKVFVPSPCTSLKI